MRWSAAAVLLASLAIAAPAGAASLESVAPDGAYANPIFITSLPGEPDRLVVVEQGGAIKLTEDGSTSSFLDISSLVPPPPFGERGLLSMAFAPDYEDSRRFYVFYTAAETGAIQIDEFTATSIPVPMATRRPVLTIPHPGHANHNGGQLQFGPDGNLYASTGDGGGAGDPQTNAQDLQVLLGKLIRIDPRESGSDPYSVPADNPFVGAPGRDEIWSYGLRNPFRFSFDRLTGALLIGDVGQRTYEEVDYEPQPNAGRGDNFGWSCREGFEEFVDVPPGIPDPACAGATGFTDPIHAYSHDGGNCSITGGYVSRDPGIPDLAGRYLYADFCASVIRSLIPGLPLASDDRSEGLSVISPSSFGEDACGRLYVASLNTDDVFRIVGDAPTGCSQASVAGGVLDVEAEPGVANRFVVAPSSSGTHWVVRDDNAPVTAAAGCEQLGARARCPLAAVTALRVDSADRDDRIAVSDGLDTTLMGGSGDDILVSRDGADGLQGGGGADTLTAGAGVDLLDGGGGRDSIDGGAGRDTATYAGRSASQPVSVSLDDVANDGGALDGGGDNVAATVESLRGGAGDDDLTGSAAGNVIIGGAGIDVLAGLAADDSLFVSGDGANDVARCGAGAADHVFADPGDHFPSAGANACELVN